MKQNILAPHKHHRTQLKHHWSTERTSSVNMNYNPAAEIVVEVFLYEYLHSYGLQNDQKDWKAYLQAKLQIHDWIDWLIEPGCGAKSFYRDTKTKAKSVLVKWIPH